MPRSKSSSYGDRAFSCAAHGRGKLGCVYAVTVTAMSILLLREGNYQVLVILTCSKLLMNFQTEIS